MRGEKNNRNNAELIQSTIDVLNLDVYACEHHHDMNEWLLDYYVIRSKTGKKKYSLHLIQSSRQHM